MIDPMPSQDVSLPPTPQEADLLAEINRLRDVLIDIEFLTATGDGLEPDHAMTVHLLAAEGRAHEPQAWRLDPRVVKLVHTLVREKCDDILKGSEA